MQTNARLRYDMSGRVGEFSHTHPAEDPTTLQVVARLTELNTRVETLSQLQRSSVTIAAAAVSQKTQLRFDIENGLAGLFGIAQVASATHPEITVDRRRIRPHASEVTLLTAALVAVAENTWSSRGGPARAEIHHLGDINKMVADLPTGNIPGGLRSHHDG